MSSRERWPTRDSSSGPLIHLCMLACDVLYRVSPRVLPIRVRMAY